MKWKRTPREQYGVDHYTKAQETLDELKKNGYCSDLIDDGQENSKANHYSSPPLVRAVDFKHKMVK